MSVIPFDVVTVPDFSGKRARWFELRALSFLASWMENAGKARSLPLHLACIGEPPLSVSSAARRCGASITVHSPANGFLYSCAHKLRGMEIDSLTGQVLLLDTDFLILSDFSGLGALGNCIAASPSNKPNVPPRYWSRIYRALEMPEPAERMACVRWELGLPPVSNASYSGMDQDMSSMHPYYQGGAVYYPADCDLRRLWEDYGRRIAALFRPENEAFQSVARSDQASLSTAIERLRRDGVPVRRLPTEYHAHYMHLLKRTPGLSGVRLYHAMGLLKGETQPPASLHVELTRYRNRLLRRLLWEWQLDCRTRRIMSVRRNLLPACRDAFELTRSMRDACIRHLDAPDAARG